MLGPRRTTLYGARRLPRSGRSSTQCWRTPLPGTLGCGHKACASPRLLAGRHRESCEAACPSLDVPELHGIEEVVEVPSQLPQVYNAMDFLDLQD